VTQLDAPRSSAGRRGRCACCASRGTRRRHRVGSHTRQRRTWAVSACRMRRRRSSLTVCSTPSAAPGCRSGPGGRSLGLVRECFTTESCGKGEEGASGASARWGAKGETAPRKKGEASVEEHGREVKETTTMTTTTTTTTTVTVGLGDVQQTYRSNSYARSRARVPWPKPVT
jgi:hypothetical protein